MGCTLIIKKKYNPPGGGGKHEPLQSNIKPGIYSYTPHRAMTVARKPHEHVWSQLEPPRQIPLEAPSIARPPHPCPEAQTYVMPL
ncbi:hypothetical protein HKD37_02G004702 [Glycine soja]